MGVMVYVFMNLSLKYSNFISPIIIGSQLAIPFGVLASAIMLKENISKKKWLFVFTAFIGIVIVFFDPDLKNNLLGLFFATLMALFFAFAQVYSRDLRKLNKSFTFITKDNLFSRRRLIEIYGQNTGYYKKNYIIM